MAKYNVTYTCGHTGRIELFGKYSDRENRINWLENNSVCQDCYRAAKEAERAAEAKIAAEKNKGLPQLIGTPKQIAWAETIRAEILKDAKMYRANAEAATDPETKIRAEAILNVINGYEAHVSASWWINHRRDSLLADIEATLKTVAEIHNIK